MLHEGPASPERGLSLNRPRPVLTNPLVDPYARSYGRSWKRMADHMPEHCFKRSLLVLLNSNPKNERIVELEHTDVVMDVSILFQVGPRLAPRAPVPQLRFHTVQPFSRAAWA